MEELRIQVEPSGGSVSAALLRPPDAQWLYVFAHGAGAGMRHAFMDAMAERLASRRVATLRYMFPYMEAGKKLPGRRGLLEPTVRAAVEAAETHVPDLPRIAGGKSMGGRMTSRAHAAEPLPKVRGIAFLGFPLHPAKKPATERGEHLSDVNVPMLFLQGTRDDLASLELLRPVCGSLDAATLHIVEGADHAFKVLKRSGRTNEEVLDELADAIAGWLEQL